MQTYRKPLPNTNLEYFDAKAAINEILPQAYEKMPYCLRIFAENLLRNAEKIDNPEMVQTGLKQLALQENTHTIKISEIF